MSDLTAKSALEYVLPKLRDAIQATQWSLAANARDAWIHAYDRAGVLFARPVADRIQIEIRDVAGRRDTTVTFLVESASDIDCAWPEIQHRAAWWAGRLTLFRFRDGATYVVVRPFKDDRGTPFGKGDMLMFVRMDFARYDGYYVLNFREAGIIADEEGDLLRNIDAYLEER